MNPPIPTISPGDPKKTPGPKELAGCCAGRALGCGCSSISTWIAALLASLFLAPLFGTTGGGNTLVGFFLSALTFVGSLIIAGVISFFVGRYFPVFQKTRSGK